MEHRNDMIRLATTEDAPAIAALVQRAYTPWVPLVEKRPRPMDDDFAKRCANGHAYVIERNDVLLGALVIESMPEHLFVHNVAVEPAFHSQGIGRRLMQFAEDQAKQRGLTEVQLSTLEGMARNVAIYERLGYVTSGRLNVGKFDRLTMVKRLGQ